MNNLSVGDIDDEEEEYKVVPSEYEELVELIQNIGELTPHQLALELYSYGVRIMPSSLIVQAI